MESDEQRMLEKIRRLFELAKSSNEHESAAAAEKAQELLHKYNLSLADLPGAKPERYCRDLVKLKNKARWAQSLYHVVSKANACQTVILHNGEHTIAVMGQRSNLDISEYVYAQLERRIRLLSESAWDLYGEGNPTQYMSSFAYGAIGRLDERLSKRTEAFRRESPESMKLMVVQGRELESAVKQWYPFLGSSRPDRVGAGYDLGAAAGSRMGINAGVGSGAGQRRLK